MTKKEFLYVYRGDRGWRFNGKTPRLEAEAWVDKLLAKEAKEKGLKDD